MLSVRLCRLIQFAHLETTSASEKQPNNSNFQKVACLTYYCKLSLSTQFLHIIKVMHKLGHKHFFFILIGGNYPGMTFSMTSLESENEWEATPLYKLRVQQDSTVYSCMSQSEIYD